MLKDKPMRECSKFFGENGRFATVYQDLVTREFIVQRSSAGFESGLINKYKNMLDAENSAEDWVMKQ
jgi:hypothetical protein